MNSNVKCHWWKFVVLTASFFNHAIIWGLALSAGIFQVVFIDEFSKNAISGISFISSLVSTLTCLVGPISSILTNRFGCRPVALAGAVLGSAALLMSSAAQSLWQMFVAFSLLGFGLGIAYIPSVVIVCRYFDEKRPLAIGFAATGLGVGTFVMPLIIRLLVDRFHWRNAMIILAGITLNMAVMAATFRSPRSSTSNDSENDSLTDSGAAIVKKKIIRVKMWRQLSFVCLFINNFLLLFGIVAFYVHLPAHLSTVDFDNVAGAMFVSVTGAGTLIGRLATGFIAQCLTQPLLIYTATMGMGGIVMILIPLFTSYANALVALCFLFGLCTSTIGPLLPLIITDLLGLDALSDSYGYLLVAEALGSFLGPPFAGMLYDWNRNYASSMYYSGLIILIASLLMLFPLAANYVRKGKNRDESNETICSIENGAATGGDEKLLGSLEKERLK